MLAVTLYAQSTGNWDKASNWNTDPAGGGTAYTNPQNGTDTFTCYANGYTVTMNVDVVVTSLSTRAGSGTAGGGFTTASQTGRTITADAYAGTTNCVTLVNGTTSQLIGASYGSDTTTSRYGARVGSGCTHTGNSFGGSVSGSGTDVLTGGVQNGDSFAGSASYAYGTTLQSLAVQNGNSTGGSVSYAAGTSASSGAVQNGNSQAGSATGSYGTTLSSGSIQNGNSVGGSGSSAYGTYCEGGSFHNGNSRGGTSTAYGTYVSNGGIQNGNSVGGAANGCFGTQVGSGGIQCGDATQSATHAASGTSVQAAGKAFIGTATGSSAARGYGVESAARSLVLIKTEVGAYAKYLVAGTDTTDTNVPMVNYGTGNGYTYGDEDPSKVLTTASGAGTYQPVAATHVLAGVAVGVSPAVGTLTLPAADYVLTAAWGGPATYGVGGTGSTPTATLTDAANVWHTASVFGAGGNSVSPSKVGSSIPNLTAGNIKSGVTIEDVIGTYEAIGTYPDPEYVHVDAGPYGPTGAEYTPELSALSLWYEVEQLADAEFRAGIIADAWANRLNAVNLFGEPTNAQRVFEVSDTLGARETRAVHVIGKSDVGEPLSRRSWLHEIQTATALRVRVGADNASRDVVAQHAQKLCDYARLCRPLCYLNGHAVTLKGTAQTLWLPQDLQKYGVYDSIVIHTWRVEVVDPTLSAASSESSSDTE